MKSTFSFFSLVYICLLIAMISCDSNSGKPGPRTHLVEIKQMQFQPAELMVHQGDTVVWINKDIVDHDVTEEPGATWTSSRLPAGQSWSLVVNESADYYCSLHVVMKGKLIVQ